MSIVKTESVESVGTGRTDYSVNIEYAVEPLIRSYEGGYSVKQDFTDIAPGAASTVNITLPDKVVFIYNLLFSATANSLFRVTVRAVSTAGVAALIFHRWGYGSFSYTIPRGFPFLGTLRVAITNLGSETRSYIFCASGLETDETIYILGNPQSEPTFIH